MAFSGNGRYRVDAKGRVSIPADFRRTLQANDSDCLGDGNPRVIIIYGLQAHFLECYSDSAFQKLCAQIQALEPGSLERDHFTRLYVAQSYATQIDDNGRLILPQNLRERVNIGEQAHFYGWIETFRIASPERYEKELNETEMWLGEVQKSTHPLNVLSVLTETRKQTLRTQTE